ENQPLGARIWIKYTVFLTSFDASALSFACLHLAQSQGTFLYLKDCHGCTTWYLSKLDLFRRDNSSLFWPRKDKRAQRTLPDEC
ncbi:MAG: hypothetical protein ACK4UN_22520, partial [Limisphaerales bacterium]